MPDLTGNNVATDREAQLNQVRGRSEIPGGHDRRPPQGELLEHQRHTKARGPQ
jgi:hypothetical protein